MRKTSRFTGKSGSVKKKIKNKINKKKEDRGDVVRRL